MFRRNVAAAKPTRPRNYRASSLKHSVANLCAMSAVVVFALVVVSCSSAPSAPDAALTSLSADRLMANIKDAFLGSI